MGFHGANLTVEIVEIQGWKEKGTSRVKGNGARKGKQVEMDEGNKGEAYKYGGIKETEVMEGKWTYSSLSTFFIRKSRPNKKDRNVSTSL